jgi:hypothetical protein
LKFYKKTLNIKNQPLIPKLNLPYLPKGEQLKRTKYTTTIKTLKKSGLVTSKSQNKK